MEGQKQLIDNSIKRARQLREQGRNRELALAQEKLIQEQEQQHKAEDELIRLQKEAQDLEILVKNQEITKNIAIAKATASSTPSTTNGETNATGNELFPHALKCKKEVQSVERLLGDVARQNLSPMAQSVISVCTNTLQKTMSLLKSQSSSNTSLSDEVFAPLCKCVRDISKVINFTIRDDPKLLTKLALTLFDTIISSAVSPSTSQIPSEGVRDQCILAHTVIVLGFFKELSGNLASQLSVLFRGILYQKASLLLPVLSVSNSEKKSVNEPTVLAIKFFASLCSSHTMSTILSPLSAETGWQWLSCVHHEIKNNDTLINDSHTTIARMIIYFLSFAGSYLLSVYGIEFIKLLKNIHVTISTLIETGKLTNADVARDWKGLQGYLARVVADQFISARCLFGVEPHVVQGYFIKWYATQFLSYFLCAPIKNTIFVFIYVSIYIYYSCILFIYFIHLLQSC